MQATKVEVVAAGESGRSVVDGTHVLADVTARTIQPSWRVVRGRRWRALRYSLFVAVFLVLVLLSNAETVDSLHIPAVSNLVGSGPVLLAIAVVLVGAAVIRPFLQSRTHVVVLLPEGFVYGNTRSGRVYRSVTYASVSGLQLGTTDITTTGLVMRPYLTWRDERGTMSTWAIPGYFTLTAMQLATLVLMQHAQAQGPAGDGAADASPPSAVSAAEAIALARTDQAPPSWEVIQTKWRPTPWRRWMVRYFVYPAMAALFAFLLVSLGWIGHYVYGALFIKGFVGSTSTLAIASAIAPAVFFVPFLTILLVYLYYCFLLVRVYRQVAVVTPEGVVIGDRISGAVLSTFAWREGVRLDVSHFSTMSFFRFRGTRGKPVTVAFVWLTTRRGKSRLHAWDGMKAPLRLGWLVGRWWGTQPARLCPLTLRNVARDDVR